MGITSGSDYKVLWHSYGTPAADFRYYFSRVIIFLRFSISLFLFVILLYRLIEYIWKIIGEVSKKPVSQKVNILFQWPLKMHSTRWISRNIAGTYSEPYRTSKMKVFVKIVNVFQPLSFKYFYKKLHLRCLTWLWIRLWLEQLNCILFKTNRSLH